MLQFVNLSQKIIVASVAKNGVSEAMSQADRLARKPYGVGINS
jgi:hypothetical protein